MTAGPEPLYLQWNSLSRIYYFICHIYRRIARYNHHCTRLSISFLPELSIRHVDISVIILTARWFNFKQVEAKTRHRDHTHALTHTHTHTLYIYIYIYIYITLRHLLQCDSVETSLRVARNKIIIEMRWQQFRNVVCSADWPIGRWFVCLFHAVESFSRYTHVWLGIFNLQRSNVV